MGEVMVNYCKAMHYKLIVEGIETKEELECLIQLGIEYGQGYYLKKPVDNFDDLLPDIKETIKKLYNKYKKTLDIPTIDSLCHFPCTLKTYQNINNAYQIFEENNTTQRIYVINDEGHYLGYLKRENILCDLDIVEPNLFKDSLIVPSHLPIKNVCQLFLENEHSHFYEDIIVLKNQCFYGIVTIKDLLKYLIKIDNTHFPSIKYNLIKGFIMFYKCYNNRNISIKGDYIMSIKLVKASNEYQDLIVDMLKEWIDYNNNHSEANTSPASIFKNDYHNFDYYINNLDLKNPKPGL